jgi:hypothetical protein
MKQSKREQVTDADLIEALELDRSIKGLQDRLKELKAKLVAAAAGENRDFTASNGEVVHVSFPDPGLIRGGFWFLEGQAVIMDDKEVVKLGPVKKLAGDHFDKLFAPFWKPAKAFREIARVLLSSVRADKLITLLETESSPRVTFETKTSASLAKAA